MAVSKRLFIIENKYTVIKKGKDEKYSVYSNLTKQALVHHYPNKTDREGAISSCTIIGGIEHKVNYIQKKPSVISTFTHTDNKKWVRITDNPILDWEIVDDNDINEDIIKDYDNITGGLMPDIVETTAQILLTENDRFNKIVIIGNNGVGKTRGMTMMGFVALTPAETEQALVSGRTGISIEKSKKIARSGLLLFDDPKKIPEELKLVTNRADLTVKHKGALEHETKVIAITSTDVGLFSALGGEWDDRLFVFVIPFIEGNSIQHSKVYLDDPVAYLEHTTAWLRNLWIKHLAQEPNPKRLGKLHKKYSLENISEAGDILQIAVEEVFGENNVGFIKAVNGDWVIRTLSTLKEELTAAVVKHNGGIETDAGTQVSRMVSKMFLKRTNRLLEDGKTPKVYILKDEHKHHLLTKDEKTKAGFDDL